MAANVDMTRPPAELACRADTWPGWVEAGTSGGLDSDPVCTTVPADSAGDDDDDDSDAGNDDEAEDGSLSARGPVVSVAAVTCMSRWLFERADNASEAAPVAPPASCGSSCLLDVGRGGRRRRRVVQGGARHD